MDILALSALSPWMTLHILVLSMLSPWMTLHILVLSMLSPWMTLHILVLSTLSLCQRAGMTLHILCAYPQPLGNVQPHASHSYAIHCQAAPLSVPLALPVAALASSTPKFGLALIRLLVLRLVDQALSTWPHTTSSSCSMPSRSCPTSPPS